MKMPVLPQWSAAALWSRHHTTWGDTSYWRTVSMASIRETSLEESPPPVTSKITISHQPFCKYLSLCRLPHCRFKQLSTAAVFSPPEVSYGGSAVHAEAHGKEASSSWTPAPAAGPATLRCVEGHGTMTQKSQNQNKRAGFRDGRLGGRFSLFFLLSERIFWCQCSVYSTVWN